MSFKKLLSDALKVLATILILVLLIPVIAPVVIWFALVNFWARLIIPKLRNDPKIKLTPFIKAPQDSGITLEDATKYFNDLVNAISKASKSKIKNSSHHPSEWIKKDHAQTRTHTLQAVIASEFATINFELVICEDRYSDGELDFYKPDDGIPGLADSIESNIVVNKFKNKPSRILLDYTQVGAYFCIGILRGERHLNNASNQWWSYYQEEDIWIVKYKQNSCCSFGFRKSLKDKAREYWFDAK